MKDRHVIEALGKTKVVVEDGKVVFVGEPSVTYCPLFAKHRGIKEITPEVVRENVEFRIRDFGMCAPSRKLRMRDFLTFGVSELLSMAVADQRLDCAVLVADGAGTVIITDPEMIQGIGGRISGMIETTPIMEIIEAVGRENVLDPEKGTIDQFAGVEKAFALGHRKVAVTVAKAEQARMIRDGFNPNVMIFAVHTTGADEKDAKTFFDCCDIVTGCASHWVRLEGKKRALLQAGSKVPVYAASPEGKRLIEDRFKQMGKKIEVGPEDPPRPLVQ
jgi:putative methanogenesis marker protein 8